MPRSLRQGLRLCSPSSVSLRGAKTAEDFQLTRLKHISGHKCDGFSIIDTTEIRMFKIPTRLIIPTKSIILLQMNVLRRIHRLGTNPD